MITVHLCPRNAATWRNRLPSKACKLTAALAAKAYSAAGQAASALHAMALLQVQQAKSKICAQTALNWITALPIALMAVRGSTNRRTKLTPHEMVTGRRTPRGDREMIEIEDVDKLKSELDKYVTTLTKIHASIFQTESRPRETPDESNRSGPIAVGDLVYIKVYRRKWDEPRCEGLYEVTSATPTSIKVQGSNFWYHISHCLKINTNKSEVITHEAKNMFESPEEEALGHCISKDCALGAGIALEFRNRYGEKIISGTTKGGGRVCICRKERKNDTTLNYQRKSG